MRFVARESVAGPASLLSPNRIGAAERKRAADAFGADPPSTIEFKAYKEADVRRCLHALFHGKCAYCEARYEVTGPVDIEHYRPKGAVDGEPDHPGYWWLAADWSNLLPSCIDCNRRRTQATPTPHASLAGGVLLARGDGYGSMKTGKGCAFPLAEGGVRVAGRPAAADAAQVHAAEQALLLNPCIDTPEDYLCYNLDPDMPLGVVYATCDGVPALDPSEDLASWPAGFEDIRELEREARKRGINTRAVASIQVYGLNRLALVQERARILRRLEFLGGMVIELAGLADDIEGLAVDADQHEKQADAVRRLRAAAQRTLAQIRDMAEPQEPFSTMVRQWIGTFTAPS